MLIIDVGAHNGSRFSIPCAQDPNNVVYAIEPISGLAEAIRAHQLPNLHVFGTAVGVEPGTCRLPIHQSNGTVSSLSPQQIDAQPFSNLLEEIATIEAPVVRLDTFLEQNFIAEVDLLRINTQNSNLEILKSAGQSIHQARRIILEMQSVSSPEMSIQREDVIEYLTNRGFRLISAALQSNGLSEHLEFLRINRYPLVTPRSQHFDVNVPHVGTVRTPKSDHVGQLLEEGVFEGPEQAFLWLYLRPGDTFFDCGAHVGLFSCIATKRLNNTGQIVGFEPNSFCFELYTHNLKSMGCSCFRALNVGLSNTRGTRELLLGKTGMSAFSTFATGATTHTEISQDKVLVEQCLLDDVVEECSIKQVTLAKIDVEGWEAFVFEGARQSIVAKKFPLWMVEFTETNAVAAGSSTLELRKLIESFGYTLCRFDATNFRLVPEPAKMQYPYDNLFAVMDLESVNQRLATADSSAVEIARDIITRWDAMMTASGARYHERHVSQELRQQLLQLQQQLQEQQEQVVQSQEQVVQSQEQVVQSQEQVVQSEEQIVQLRDQLHKAQVELSSSRSIIEAMQSSRFWKLRSIWFQFKQIIGRIIPK